MNRPLLRQTRQIIRPENLPPGQERTFLTRTFALAWAQKRTSKPQTLILRELGPFLPTSVPVRAETRKKLAALLKNVPAGEEGEPNALTPEILALACEQTDAKRRTRGVFYTPEQTARILIQETLSAQNTGPETLHRLTACDPAAGAGGLLIPLWLELGNRTRKQGDAFLEAALLEEISHRLYGADLDALSLNTLRLRAALTLYGRGHTPKRLFPNLLAADALAGEKTTIWREKFPDVFCRGGFDLVLANPPYLGQKNHKEVFEPLRQNPRWKPYLAPRGDLLYLFFHLALEILKPQGTAGFLTTAYFTQAAAAAGLRTRLKREAAFLRLRDFQNSRLFEDAPGQHNLISVFQKTTDQTVPCRVGEENKSVPQKALYSGPSNFLNTRPPDDKTASLLQKMAAAPHRLKDVARVSNGLMTGCDKISAAHLHRHPLPGVQKGDGVFVLSQQEKDALDLPAAEEAKLKPFFKNSDIFPFAARTVPQRWLVDFFYPNDRETDFSKYPRLTAHLARFKPILLARKQNNNGIDKILQKGVYWFGSVRRKMNFETEKLAAPQRAHANTFAYLPGPWYASSDVYFISSPKPGLSLWYLLALLNSAPYYAWLFCNGKRKGGLLELYAQPLEELPVPLTVAEECIKLEELARRVYAAKAKDPQADSSAWETQINRLVGALFNLTEEEIYQTEQMQKNARKRQRNASCHTSL